MLILLWACAGGGDTADEGDAGGPDIDVTPTVIEFGEIALDTLQPVQTVTVSNEGDMPLAISAYSLVGDTPAFRLSAIGTVLVEQGYTTTFTVTFAPESAGLFEDQVTIASDDADEPEVIVDLRGSGVEGR